MYLEKIDGQGDGGPVALERARGQARVSVARARGATLLVDLAQAGSARLLLPRTANPWPEAVFLNTSGGLTSGDHLSFGIDLGADAMLTATTQTAERAYLARGGPAKLTVGGQVAAGAMLEWLPQETILFEGANLERETRIDLGPGARCLLAETVVLGRRAMGETVGMARLTDRRQVTLEGRPLWFETLVLSPEVLAMADGPAGLGGAVAFATLALCGEGAEAAAADLRNLETVAGVTFAVSGWAGRTVLRATAHDLWPLKRLLARAIARLTCRPLPRVWQMQGATS